MKKRYVLILVAVILAALFAVLGKSGEAPAPAQSASLLEIPEFSGQPYVVLNGNVPDFEGVAAEEAYEHYSELDALNRCGYALACIGTELMPTEERGSIGQVKPSGWQTVKYDFVDGKYLYNRCHLIGYQLTGENANERNLITGTRYLNVEGMLPFENMVADYIKETGNHVLYRVTPVFRENEAVARGVQMEALSVEDDGAGICFNIYAYNNQPGVQIDYATGESREETKTAETIAANDTTETYILNTGSRKFHKLDCGQGQQTKDENKKQYTGSRQALIDDGYAPAGCCDP